MPQLDKKTDQSFAQNGVGRTYEAMTVIGDVLATDPIDMSGVHVATFILTVNMIQSNIGNSLDITEAKFEMDNDPGFSNPVELTEENFNGSPSDFVFNTDFTNQIITKKIDVRGVFRYVRLTFTVDNNAVELIPIPLSGFTVKVALHRDITPKTL